MKILSISGSAREDSSNMKLLKALPFLLPGHEFNLFNGLKNLPLFQADFQNEPTPEPVRIWKEVLSESEAVIISTPEYIYNMPALLKNAFEWVTATGEFSGKKVLAISFTPHPPRGEKAMQSLLWSLKALDAQVVVQLPLYQNEIEFGEDGRLLMSENVEALVEALGML